MTKYFKERKKPYSGAILDHSCPNLGKNESPRTKRALPVLNIPIIYHRAKNQEKLMTHS